MVSLFAGAPGPKNGTSVCDSQHFMVRIFSSLEIGMTESSKHPDARAFAPSKPWSVSSERLEDGAGPEDEPGNFPFPWLVVVPTILIVIGAAGYGRNPSCLASNANIPTVATRIISIFVTRSALSLLARIRAVHQAQPHKVSLFCAT